MSSGVAATLALLCAAAAPAGSVRLVFGGDVIPHAPVKAVALERAKPRSSAAASSSSSASDSSGWDHVLGALRPVLGRADEAIVNLETPVAAREIASTGPFVFNAPPELLESLRASGVTIATFANNHSLDQGEAGIVETRQALALAGLLSAGASVTSGEAWRPLRFERGGLRFGLLAITRWLNGRSSPLVPVVPYGVDHSTRGASPAAALERVRAAAESVDVLVVAVHWGEEYSPEPLRADRVFAQALVDAGARIVIGHHPHVLQPVELLKSIDGSSAVVAYSLGNLLSNQGLGDELSPQRDGLLLAVNVGRGADGRAEIRGLEGVPTATENAAGPGRRRNVQVVLVDQEIELLGGRLDQLFFRKDWRSRSEQAALLERLEVARSRRRRIMAHLPPVPPHAPTARR